MYKLQKLVLGTAQFGSHYGIANTTGQISDQDIASIFELADAHKINTIDTAIGYGNSEERLGKHNLSSYNVISKLPRVPESCTDVFTWVRESTIQSLTRLNVPKLDGLLVHHCDELMKPYGDELYKGLISVREDGLVNKIGTSIYAPDDLNSLIPKYKFQIIQSPLNIFDTRIISSNWAKRLCESGTELHVRSIFLQGLLLMPGNKRPGKFNEWSSLWKIYEQWLSDSAITPLEATINHAFSFEEVSKVLVGVDSLAQLKEIVSTRILDLFHCPETLQTSDQRLINPSKWATL